MLNRIDWATQVKERTIKLRDKKLVAYAKPNGECYIRMTISKKRIRL